EGKRPTPFGRSPARVSSTSMPWQELPAPSPTSVQASPGEQFSSSGVAGSASQPVAIGEQKPRAPSSTQVEEASQAALQGGAGLLPVSRSCETVKSPAAAGAALAARASLRPVISSE